MHPEIDNPEYSPDSNIYKFDNIGVLGLDLWQVRHGSSLRYVVAAVELQSNSFGFPPSSSGEIWYNL